MMHDAVVVEQPEHISGLTSGLSWLNRVRLLLFNHKKVLDDGTSLLRVSLLPEVRLCNCDTSQVHVVQLINR